MKAACRTLLLLFVMALSFQVYGQAWVDSMDRYVREDYMPEGKYVWTWQRASLLRAMVFQYEYAAPADRPKYLQYIKAAMESSMKRAHGKRPNAVASGQGMAFLYRVTGNARYLEVADRIYADFKNIIRVEGGGVSHKAKWPELWDDTIYMVGVFLLEMYRATGEERYLRDLMDEFKVHRERLMVEEWGLWVHGWDGDRKEHITFCGQKGWADTDSRQSAEIWGRGNGWVIVTLSEALTIVPRDSEYYPEFASYLLEMIEHLPELQDDSTGHWYQLPVRKDEPGNFIESSCTAMFGFGILTALEHDLVRESTWEDAAMQAYKGLRQHSIQVLPNGHLTPMNVCKGTCIGDKNYYFNRKATLGKPFGLAMFIQFGRMMEVYMDTAVNDE